jgi:adenylylsulfate kinase
LITGVYGSGKSSVAAEIADVLEHRERRFALLDLDYLGWASDDESELPMMLRNLSAVAANYRDARIDLFVLAYFVRDLEVLRGIREALCVPLRVVRLSVPLSEIERRLASDVTSGRRDDLRDAASSLEHRIGIGVEDFAIDNDRPVASIAREVMSWLGWL